jgi:hypothetical protein
VPNGFLVEQALADRISQGAEVQVRFRTGRPAPGWSPVFELVGPRGPVLSVDAVGRNLAYQPSLQAYRLRLRRPALHLPEALSSSPGLEVRVVAGRRENTLWGVWTDSEGTDTATQVLSASFGWSLFTPTRYAFGREVHLITAVWVAGWLAVAAYWWGTARRRAPATISGFLLLAALGLGLVPRMFGYSSAHWSEWVGALGGAAAGFTGSRFAAYFRRRCDSPSINESC